MNTPQAYIPPHETLREALEDIANMPEYDQDDARRLRHKARQALAKAEGEALPSSLTVDAVLDRIHGRTPPRSILKRPVTDEEAAHLIEALKQLPTTPEAVAEEERRQRAQKQPPVADERAEQSKRCREFLDSVGGKAHHLTIPEIFDAGWAARAALPRREWVELSALRKACDLAKRDYEAGGMHHLSDEAAGELAYAKSLRPLPPPPVAGAPKPTAT